MKLLTERNGSMSAFFVGIIPPDDIQCDRVAYWVGIIDGERQSTQRVDEDAFATLMERDGRNWSLVSVGSDRRSEERSSELVKLLVGSGVRAVKSRIIGYWEPVDPGTPDLKFLPDGSVEAADFLMDKISEPWRRIRSGAPDVAGEDIFMEEFCLSLAYLAKHLDCQKSIAA